MSQENLFGKTKTELESITSDLGLPKYTSSQLTEWLYKKKVTSIDQMTNLSVQNRELLKRNFVVSLEPPVGKQESVDGTRKYLFKANRGGYIEAAYIPDQSRATLCVSSQVGCKMGCLFCMTGKQGFQRHLLSGEIINQIISIPETNKLTNVVFMGMGEPLDNTEEVLKSLEILTSDYGFGWSPKRITVSSIGIIPGLKEFLSRSKCHLAISLHNPYAEERMSMMPIQHVYPIGEVLSVIKAFDFGIQRRVSFEYIMFQGINDTLRHANELSRILNGIRCRINLIRFHPIPDTPLHGSSDEAILLFQEKLQQKGLLVTIRASRGLDILAACGLLSTKELVQKRQVDE